MEIRRIKVLTMNEISTTMLLLVLLYSVHNPALCSSDYLDESVDSLQNLYEEPTDPEIFGDEVEIRKRAPWAPSEIRYDSFVQKLMAGKARYSTRDKHSDQQLQRSSRSWKGNEDTTEQDTLKRVDDIYKLLKQIEKEVEGILSVRHKEKGQYSSTDLSSRYEESQPVEGDGGYWKIDENVRPEPVQTGSVKLLENLLREIGDRLQKERNKNKGSGIRRPRSAGDDLTEDFIYGEQGRGSYSINEYPEISEVLENQPENFLTEANLKNVSRMTVDKWIQLLRNESESRQENRNKSKSRNKDRRKRHYGMGLGQEVIESILSEPIQSYLENDKRIHGTPSKANSAIRFIG